MKQPPHPRSTGPHRLVRLAGGVALATFMVAAFPAHARGVTAGTLITNTATASFPEGAGTTTITSNTVSLRVDEIIDIVAVAQDVNDLTVRAGSTDQVRAFTLTNEGNGAGTFTLNAVGFTDGGAFSPTVTGIAIDSNANGVYDPGTDAIVASGATSPSLAPDASLAVFVLSTIPDSATDGQRGAVRLTAVSTIGTGTAGTVFAGRGQGGGDAIIGSSGGDADDKSGFAVSRGTVALAKTAALVDPYGGTRAMPGSIVTYSIAAQVSGSGDVPGLRVTDVIPDGTEYQPGTLTIDAAALTDAADTDGGEASAAGVSVLIGTVPAGATRTVQFKVKIK